MAFSVDGPDNHEFDELRDGGSLLVPARGRAGRRGVAHPSGLFIGPCVYGRRALAGAGSPQRPVLQAGASQPNLISGGSGSGSSRSRVVEPGLAISQAERVRKSPNFPYPLFRCLSAEAPSGERGEEEARLLSSGAGDFGHGRRLRVTEPLRVSEPKCVCTAAHAESFRPPSSACHSRFER